MGRDSCCRFWKPVICIFFPIWQGKYAASNILPNLVYSLVDVFLKHKKIKMSNKTKKRTDSTVQIQTQKHLGSTVNQGSSGTNTQMKNGSEGSEIAPTPHSCGAGPANFKSRLYQTVLFRVVLKEEGKNDFMLKYTWLRLSVKLTKTHDGLTISFSYR